MRKIFIKVNGHYMSEYRTITTITNSDADREVIKEGMGEASGKHISNLLWGYDNVRKYFPNLEFCPPKAVENGVKFPYIYGKTMTEMFLEAMESGNKEEFLKLIKRHLFSLETQADNLAPFELTVEFQKYFGFDNSENLTGVQAMKCCAFDCTSNNLIIDSDDKVHYIDYEYCFNFLIPVSLYKYHCIHSLYYYDNKFEEFIPFSQIAELLKLDVDLEILKRWKKNFVSYLEDPTSPMMLRWQYLKSNMDCRSAYEAVQKNSVLEEGLQWYQNNAEMQQEYIERQQKQIQKQDKILAGYQENDSNQKKCIDILKDKCENQLRGLQWYWSQEIRQKIYVDALLSKITTQDEQMNHLMKDNSMLRSDIEKVEVEYEKAKSDLLERLEQKEEMIIKLGQKIEKLYANLFQIENSKIYRIGKKLHMINEDGDTYDN